MAPSTHDLVQDVLFEKVREIVPDICDQGSDDELDLAAMMAFQAEQEQKLRAHAQQLRVANGMCAIRGHHRRLVTQL
jgi:hypothetical protein